MKKELLIIMIASGVVAACSSSWEDQYNETPFECMPSASLAVSGDALQFPENGAEGQIGITTTTYWTANTSVAWIRLSSTMGRGNATLTVMAEPNMGSTQSRNAVIQISNGIATYSVSVTQNGVVPPTISVVSVADIAKHTANLSFSFSSPHVDVTEYGVCYSSTTGTPTKDSSPTVGHQGGGRNGNPAFTLSELTSKTTYYVRAYVVSVLGLQYSETVQFTTPVSAPSEGDNETPQD